MGNCKLTVTIAMYNSCENVAKTLDKLAEQRGVYDLEVIVVDDGSTDDPSAVVDLCKEYGFIYHRQENGGEAAAREKGLNMATGDYMTWVDADDSIADDYLDIIYSEIDSGEYDFITHRWVYANGEIGCRHEPPLVNWNVWSNVYRTSKVKGVPFNQDMIIASDMEWLERAITPDMKWLDSDRFTNIYDAKNPDSLTNKFKRGEVALRKSDIK